MNANRLRRGLALSATIIASSMGFIDGTVVHIALPSIQQDLGASFSALQWIVNIYLLALCALLVISGAMGDRYGSRRLFLIGIAVFTLSSVACAAAPSATWLIVARGIQGIGAALMLPQSMAIIARLYPPEQRGRAIGIWSTAASASAATGPVIGGFLVDYGGWPYAFWVNLPLGIVAFLIALYAVPSGNNRKPVPLDWPGACLLVVALGSLVYATINLSVYVWSSLWVWPGWVCGLCSLFVFMWWERRAPMPVLPAHLLRNREFVLLNAYCLTIFAAFAALMFLLPYILITSLGLSASAAALNMLPLGICISLMARPVSVWADRVGYRAPMLYGALGIGCTTMAAFVVVWLRTPWAGALMTLSMGISAGLMVTPLTTGVLNSVATEESGLASGINHAITRIGNLVAIALFGALLVLMYRQRLGDSLTLVENPAVRSQIKPVVTSAADDLAQADISALPEALQGAAHSTLTHALDRAFVDVMLMASVFAWLAAYCAYLLYDRRVAAVR